MNSKERMMTALNGKKPDMVPVAPHWWGTYKFEVFGLNPDIYQWAGPETLTCIYVNFYEKFKPDWFHLHGGTPREYSKYKVEEVDGRIFLINDQGYRDEIGKDGVLDSQRKRPRVNLSNKQEIEDYIRKYIRLPSNAIIERGYTDHLKYISEKYGDEVFIAVNIGSPICEALDPNGYLGFEEGLIFFHTQPKMLRYFLERCYEEHLEWAKAYSLAGAHALVISETYISADIISPVMYYRLLFDIHSHYFRKIEERGLIPLVYFCGNINPLIDYIKDIGVRGLLVEESKKGFKIDILELKKRLGKEVCLFGNIDTIRVLRRGTPQDVEQAVQEQLKAAKDGGFVISNGSPLAPGTPPQNIHAMIEAARKYGIYPLTA